MNWTYSGDPATSRRDAVRFWTQDTDAERPLLSDEEIDFLSVRADAIWDDPIATAALACDVLVAKFAPEVNISGDGVSIGLEALMQKYSTLGDRLRATYDRLAGVGAEPVVFGVATFERPDFGILPPAFAVGFQDNIRGGGRQDSGYEPREIMPDSGYWTGP